MDEKDEGVAAVRFASYPFEKGNLRFPSHPLVLGIRGVLGSQYYCNQLLAVW